MCGPVSCLSITASWRNRYVAYAFGKSNGDVLDEWVFSFQAATRSSIERKTGEREITLSPVSTLRSDFSTLIIRKVF